MHRLDPNFNPNSIDVITNNILPSPYSALMDTLHREANGSDLPLSLPWNHLENAIGGLRPGTVTLLVGDPATAKTFLALELCAHMYRERNSWAYWPLERDSVFTLRRLAAVKLNRWSALDPECSRETMSTINSDENLRDFMHEVQFSVEPSPGQRRTDEYGNDYYPSCTFESVLTRLEELLDTRDLVVMDPLSALSFDAGGRYRDPWQAQEEFFKQASRMVGGMRKRLVLVQHCRKAPSGYGGAPTLHDVAGSAAFNRFSDNIVFVQYHPDGIDSEVVRPDDTLAQVTHKRSFTVSKSREGKGTGMRIACDMLTRGPRVAEYGVIKAQKANTKWSRN